VRPDGSGLRRLTRTQGGLEHPDDDSTPAWSPDGSRIAWANNGDGDLDLFVMRADGSGKRRVARTRGVDEFDPAWSADGRRILAITQVFPEPLKVSVIPLDGGDASPLWRAWGADWL
jgi:TolB protein